MEFNEWQLERLRQSLTAYRVDKAKRGKPLSWKGVVQRVLNHPRVTAPVFDAFESAPMGEWMRTFCLRQKEGERNIERLGFLAEFLALEGFLKPGELKDDPDGLGGLLGVWNYLGTDSGEAKDMLTAIGAVYVASRALPEVTLHLSLVPDRSMAFMRAEEIVAPTYDASPGSLFGTYYHKDGNRVMRGQRRGYAFLSTPENLLHIVLRGAAPDDRVTYVQAETLSRDTKAPTTLYLMRAGSLSPMSVGGDRNSDGPFLADAVFRFSPADGTAKSQVKRNPAS